METFANPTPELEEKKESGGQPERVGSLLQPTFLRPETRMEGKSGGAGKTKRDNLENKEKEKSP